MKKNLLKSTDRNNAEVATPYEGQVKVDDLREIIREEISSLTRKREIYTSKEVMEVLGVGEKLLKRYRDNGYLSYSHFGDKYWYRQQDIDKFLASNRYEAFNCT